MFPAFFGELVERDYAVNKRWVVYLEEHADSLTAEMKSLFSRLINAHHIWNCRLVGSQPESELNDVLPYHHWERLIRANFQETQHFLDTFSDEEKIRYHDSEGVQLEELAANMLFALLQNNHFYRAQLEWICRQEGMATPVAELFRL